MKLKYSTNFFPDFISQEAEKQGFQLPVPKEDLRPWLQSLKLSALQNTGQSNAVQKNKNWGIFDFCNQFLQTEDQLYTATLDLCHRLGSKNVIYAEIRFCPDLHIVKGLTPEQALLAVIKGMNFTVFFYSLDFT